MRVANRPPVRVVTGAYTIDASLPLSLIIPSLTPTSPIFAHHLCVSLQIRERIAQAGGDTWERDCPWNFVKEGGYYNELVFEYVIYIFDPFTSPHISGPLPSPCHCRYDAFAANLPHSIAAIFYMKDDSCWDKRPQNWLAQQTTTKCADYARCGRHAQL